VWWIKASIQDYVMRNWSMVRTGSTSAQKALFFNLKRVQAKLAREAEAMGMTLDQHQLREKVAMEIGVSMTEVAMMEGRLAGSDASLNATQASDEDGREWIDVLEDDGPGAAEQVEYAHDQARLRGWLAEALAGLSARERHIVAQRRLIEEPRTLESLGAELGLSKERIRQLEAAAYAKLRRHLEGNAPEVMALL
jgi:RNA polymerase sigma-32 factor